MIDWFSYFLGKMNGGGSEAMPDGTPVRPFVEVLTLNITETAEVTTE